MKPSDINKSAGDSWNLYEYMVNVSIAFEEEEPLRLAQPEIHEILIEKDYDNDPMPIFILRLMIPQTLADKIWGNDPDVTVRIDRYEQSEDADFVRETSSKELYFNETFKVIPSNSDPTYNISLRKRFRESSGYDDDELTIDDLGGLFNFILVKRECLYDSRTIANMVLRNVDLTTAVKVLLNDAKGKSVLMSNFDNSTVFDELLVPPMTRLAGIVYLKNKYGFHKEGTQVFMDFDTFYILRMNGKATAWRAREPKRGVFCISDTGQSGIISNGGVVTSTEVIMNVDMRQYSSPNSNQMLDNIDGANTLLLNELNSQYSDVTTDIGNNYSVQTTQGRNPYAETQIQYRKNELLKTRHLICTSIDLGSLTPNKEYTMVSDVTDITKEISGTYRLSRVMTSFMKEGTKFTGVSLITLKGGME